MLSTRRSPVRGNSTLSDETKNCCYLQHTARTCRIYVHQCRIFEVKLHVVTIFKKNFHDTIVLLCDTPICSKILKNYFIPEPTSWICIVLLSWSLSKCFKDFIIFFHFCTLEAEPDLQSASYLENTCFRNFDKFVAIFTNVVIFILCLYILFYTLFSCAE